MEKILKRISKSGTEANSERTPQENQTPENEPKVNKPLLDGPLPKFAWSLKPQGEVKSAKNQPQAGRDIPDDLWIKCTHCKELLYKKEFENNKKVCHKCGQHFRLSAQERIALLLDEASFVEINSRLVTSDPLEFSSPVELAYIEKAAQSRQKTGLNEAIITGFGTLEDLPLGLAVCDFAYQGGSMGSVFGEKLVRLIEGCLERQIPVLTVSASGGARMHEGMFSLMQMAKTTAALARLGEAGLAHFSLLTDPCTGGVTASYASVADVILAEPGALIGFAGPRVIEQTTKQKLPPDFQTAEFLLEHGMIDQVAPRKELRTTLAGLLRFYLAASNQAQATQGQAREVSYAR